ncbi:MAG: UDP-glucose/GDP-mannose dehydrogenase family protein [Chlamydiae bacterium]|nr:UDP-glucose/GDP-mannose dehydrogenase family protein [Chlamydiota bacterium]
MKIVIVGTGYVGLVTGACFAEMGHSVTCLDIDEKKIEKLLKGEIPIFEPGLEELVKRNVLQNRLKFTSQYSLAVPFANACFIAVPTPSKEDGLCDLSFIENAARQIGEHLTAYCVIVNKSTVPVGTSDKVQEIVQETLQKRGQNFSFDVVSNPEFLKEGAAIQDCMKPDRIVIGSESSKAIEIMKEIYAPFILSFDRILVMDNRSSEMTKYAANAMLATRISFMNEIADICKKVGANINEVRKGIGSDTRIGHHFLYPGVGYGGSCFPKDIRALIFLAKQIGNNPLLLQATETVNERQKKWMAEQIAKYFEKKGGLQGKTIAIWGLSFKPDTDDMREAPSLIIIEELIKKGVHLRLFDPIAMPNAKKNIKDHKQISWCLDEFEAAEGSDAIALLTEWKQFRLADFEKVSNLMKGHTLFDGRNQYKIKEMKKRGFDYIAVGIPDV